MKNKIAYTLRKLNEKEYSEAPEEVRKVYIHVLKKIPIDARAKARILAGYPAYFTRRQPRTFAQKVKDMQIRQPKKQKNG